MRSGIVPQQRGHALPSLLTWLAAGVAALLLAASINLDGIDDHSTERAQADDLQAAINTGISELRFAKAAQAMCGPQAAWEQLADGSVQCRTKYGRPTVTVKVSP